MKTTQFEDKSDREDASARDGIILNGIEADAPGLDRMVVFQSFALVPWLSAFNNVRLAVKAADPSWDEIRIRKKEDPKGDRVVVTYSGKFLPYRKW
jgi:ABC-type nitrate/sulfonate/bicarbonate transport system ATPase subunit